MERSLTKSNKSNICMDLKYIDAIEGSIKFDGNLSQYKNMLTMFDKLTLDEYIQEIASSLKNEEISHAIEKIKSLAEAANLNELKRFCRTCFNLIESLEGYEQRSKSDFEAIDCFKFFLDDSMLLKREIEEFTGKKVSFDEINRVFQQMRKSVEGSRLFENNLSLPLQENRLFDETKLVFGTNKGREIKLPDSSREGDLVISQEIKQASYYPLVNSSKTTDLKKEEKCILI